MVMTELFFLAGYLLSFAQSPNNESNAKLNLI